MICSIESTIIVILVLLTMSDNHCSNNSNNSQINYLTDRLSNLILLDIISKIDNNVDMICFFMTCKRLYHTIRLQSYKNIKFKELTQYPFVRIQPFIPSFKQISQHTLSHKLVLINQGNIFSKYKGIENIHILKDDGDNQFDSGGEESEQIQRVIISIKDSQLDPSLKIPSSTHSLIIQTNRHIDAPPLKYIPPSVKHVIMMCEQFKCDDKEDFIVPDTVESLSLHATTMNVRANTIVKLPNTLKSLGWGRRSNGPFISLDQFKFHTFTSMTSLTINFKDFGVVASVGSVGGGVLPPNLTFLDLSFMDIIPPSSLFKPLASSLTNLRLTSPHRFKNLYGQFIDLGPLNNLTNLYLFCCGSVKLPVYPSSIVQLDAYGGTFDYIPKSLESFQIESDLLLELYKSNPTPLPSTLTYLWITDYVHRSVPLPTGIIPHGVTSLDISIDPTKYGVLEGLIPTSVKTLDLKISHFGQTDLTGLIPSSVETLHLCCNITPDLLSFIPTSVKSFDLRQANFIHGHDGKNIKYENLSFIFPNHIETLKWYSDEIKSVTYSDSITSLSIKTTNFKTQNGKNIYSLSKNDNNNCNNNNNGVMLPKNIKKLTWMIGTTKEKNMCIRLDDIINLTNIEELEIQIDYTTLSTFSIRRFDGNNSRVLIVDNQSLFGGFIIQPTSQSPSPFYLHSLTIDHRCPFWRRFIINISKNV
ncbi:hypothetical protein DFA_10252 [Cavenderia fasciculata]|uniref:FNIP repeat-containing protein n=1 Tax=Cavenderia fasciculata TaxID=261658 RepID=F4Q9P8_CACFS|nr:uncharacterized protein DFA_10252 [Cavenderia fasciculata]EGG15417.1 hypothetical protein DFA_10252 [Cavenderia fasciculata]|eukprot:XP_004354159.1 hypothetical protein DFA_10252 [Cavenderia fasciculata]